MNFKNSQGKSIGALKNGVFSKTISGRIHILKILDAIGIDLSVLQHLPPHCEIKITDKDDGQEYVTTLDVYRDKGIKKNFGHGYQYFLPRRYFNAEETIQSSLFEGNLMVKA